jgi:hypothetical protein
MPRVGRVLTSHMDIEPRQHDLLGLDLGEGPPRRTIIFGLIVMVLWCALLIPILRVPDKITFSIYFIPPIVITMFGMRPSPRSGRRRTLTDWALVLRYGVLGHRPVVRLGTRRPTRQEFILFADRWRSVLGLPARIVPAVARPPWAGAEPDTNADQRPTGRAITITQRTTVIGGDTLLRTLRPPRMGRTSMHHRKDRR